MDQVRLAPAGARRLLRGDCRGPWRGGTAPEGYAKGPSARTGLDRLRGYFQKNPPPDLHHQTMLLWASTRLEGLMTSARQQETIRELRGRQKSDGGWCLPSLGALEPAQRQAQRSGRTQRRLRHGPGCLRASRGRCSGLRPGHPARSCLAQGQPVRVRAAGLPARSTTMKTITSPTPAPASPCWRFSVARPKRRQRPGLS